MVVATPLKSRPQSVLFVERDDDNRTMYVEYLRGRGLTIVTADTTDEGLAKAADAALVITGIEVPGSFNGIDLVSRLRASSSTQAMPIVVLTAYVFDQDKKRALAAGCDRFLPLPCLPNQLENEIRQLLKLPRRRTRRSH